MFAYRYRESTYLQHHLFHQRTQVSGSDIRLYASKKLSIGHYIIRPSLD